MLFNSLEFIVFFTLIFLIYWVLNRRLQNIFLLVSSYIFYAWWDYRFLVLIIASSAIDYLCGMIIDKTTVEKRRRFFLITSISLNLALLGIFKYFNFFADSFTLAMKSIGVEVDHTLPGILLPVGISFYTFQSMSYSIDIYQKKLRHNKSIIDFFLYISFFPQLVAGPIERPLAMLKQINSDRILKYEDVINGVAIASLGFFKKMVVADNLGVAVDTIFSNLATVSILESFIGSSLFSLQIYFDFSGYSEVALGIALMLGFNLTVNFKAPYFSKSVFEFWERWHISLSSWFRDYLYFPLAMRYLRSGDSFLNKYKAHIVTMLLMGLWHGAGFNYIIFGIFWSIVIVMSHRFEVFYDKVPGVIRVVFTFLCATFGWFLFRIERTVDIFSISSSTISRWEWYNNGLPVVLFAGVLIIILEYYYWIKKNKNINYLAGLFYVKLLFIIVSAVGCVCFSIPEKTNFIYFQF